MDRKVPDMDKSKFSKGNKVSLLLSIFEDIT